jgi:predicted TIM-barrel fold metal-dependent hydrolase
MRIDVHQHLWLDPIVEVLAHRTAPPRIHTGRDGLLLELACEPPSRVELDEVEQRTGMLALDGVDTAIVSLSAALGVESLPLDEAEALLSVYEQTARELPDEFAAWASLPLTDLDPQRVDALVREGFAGLCLPATAVDSQAALDRLGPVLERLERFDVPLFVHPGPVADQAVELEPQWWPGCVSYVGQLQAAWTAWMAFGVRAHPRLRVVFAALAGLAPLQGERLAARGWPGGASGDKVFYETSSYGRRAVAALESVVDPAQIVFGSDRPVVAPAPPHSDAIVQANPARLLR